MAEVSVAVASMAVAWGVASMVAAWVPVAVSVAEWAVAMVAACPVVWGQGDSAAGDFQGVALAVGAHRDWVVMAVGCPAWPEA
jgi:hypothetical protein